MEEILDSPRRTRQLVALVLASAILALVLRTYVLPAIAGGKPPTVVDVLGTVLDSILGILVASLVTAGFIRVLTPPVRTRVVVEVIQAYEIRQALQDALVDTREWWYRGHTGRHFRSVILPRLANDARNGNYSISIRLQILDPTNRDVLERQATYRQGLRSAGGRSRQWTPETIRNEIYATVFHVMAFATEEPLLTVEIVLANSMSVFSVDLSSSYAIVTKEDPREPALRCPAHSFFYQSFREDVRFTMAQGRVLPSAKGVSRRSYSPKTLREVLDRLGLDHSLLSADDAVEIVAMARRSPNPYA